MRVLVFYHPRVPSSEALAETLAQHICSQPPATAHTASLHDAEARAHVAEQDLLIVVGGDGSLLRAGRLSAPHQIPILGVNLGRLGFLPEVQPRNWLTVLERVLRGDYWIEERMMLQVEHWRQATLLDAYEVLNEAVVSRGALARPVRLKTVIDGGYLTTYLADGLIIATPTGSTAYALAAGGPILPPQLKNILLIAIAPHLSVDRAIVLAQGATVEVTAYSEHQAILSADGQTEVPLENGDQVRVRMSQHMARFARVQAPTYFYSNLMTRLTQNPAADKLK